jgi:hypothetical protein
VFLTASNQIVNDLRAATLSILILELPAGLETCSAQRITLLQGAFPEETREPENFVEIDQNFGRCFG